MRIISGSARGKRLAGFSGKKIRPTSDRVREAVFSILLSRLGTLDDLKVLDLFAGTGAMSLEALSRGARHAVLVDRNPEAAQVITTNLQSCRLTDRAVLIRSDIHSALPRLKTMAPFDLIFLDPPYNLGLAEETLTRVAESHLLSPQGILYAETEQKITLPENVGSLVLADRRRYGATAIHLYTSPMETSGS